GGHGVGRDFELDRVVTFSGHERVFGAGTICRIAPQPQLALRGDFLEHEMARSVRLCRARWCRAKQPGTNAPSGRHPRASDRLAGFIDDGPFAALAPMK